MTTAENKAWQLGQEYGRKQRLAEIKHHKDSQAMYREAMLMGCPISWFDVFKYGAQDIWRKNGELK